jgi:hypothetical protein
MGGRFGKYGDMKRKAALRKSKIRKGRLRKVTVPGRKQKFRPATKKADKPAIPKAGKPVAR